MKEVTPVDATTLVEIQLSTLPAYECGAVLFSYLAFPGVDEDDRRRAVHRALCYRVLREMGEEDPCWAWSPQPIKPRYLLLSPDQVRGALRSFDRRPRDRMVAARMAIAFLPQLESGQPPMLPHSVQRRSLKQMAGLVLEDVHMTDVGNVETRVWKPSRPVLHVAVALALLMDDLERAGATTLGPTLLCQSPEFIGQLAHDAERYRKMMISIPRFTPDAKSLIEFQLA